jgi:hypothetical protein
MKISDAKLAEVHDRGFTVVPGFLDAETLAEARAALWKVHPRPEDYFADPSKYPQYSDSQFAGILDFPYEDWALSRLPVYPDLIDAMERLLKTDDIEVYKIELWAKYAGAVDYAQPHHRDFGNHSLVVPRLDGAHTQYTTFILLSDVTELDGPTKIVPVEYTKDLPLIPVRAPVGAFAEQEESVTGPAGSLMIYRTSVLHRGSSFGAPGRSRFAMLIDYQSRGWRWNGKVSWPDRAGRPGFGQALTLMTPRQRDLFGWPPVGSDYWNEQTLKDVALRYPDMDLTPYAGGAADYD